MLKFADTHLHLGVEAGAGARAPEGGGHMFLVVIPPYFAMFVPGLLNTLLHM